jgi:exopolysaccharide biosynthesis WecB/TagA/CpsF family protein
MRKILYIAMPYDQGRSGISEYIRATLKALSEQCYIQLVATAQDMPELAAQLKGEGHTLHAIDPHWEHPLASLIWFQWVGPWLTLQPDLEAVFIPTGNRRLLGWSARPVISTVHDLAPLKLPGKYGALRQIYWQHILARRLQRCHQLLAISEQTSQDLQTLLAIAPEHITVAANGYRSEAYYPDPAQDKPDQDVHHRYGITQPYLLYVARIEDPGKNHIGLLEAWMAMPEALRTGYQLVLAGADWHGAERVHAWIAHHQPTGVKCLGFVPDQDLPALYRGATLYVQPSLYEGFGLPIVEAMAAGTPVLSSDQGALPEVGGGAVAYCEPRDASQWAAAMTRLLCDDAERTHLRAQGLRRAQQFSWTAHAEKIIGLLPSPHRLQLMGLALTNQSLAETLELLRQRLRYRNKTRIFYINADCLNVAAVDPAYRQHLQQAEYRLPDGSGVRLGAALTRQKLVANLNGTDMFPNLCELAVQEQQSLYLLGGRPEVNATLVQKLRQRWPGIKIAGHHHGYFSPEEEPALIEAINVSGAGLLFVALGAPRQEAFISRHFQALQVPLMLGVGGLFDFYAERIPRAPLWMRQLGCEWLWRLAQEPLRLWRRYILGNPIFVARMLKYGRHWPHLSEKADTNGQSCLINP